MSEALRLAEESTSLAERRLESDGYEWSVDADVQLRETAAELRRLAPMEAELQQARAELTELRAQVDSWREHCDTLTHQVICCGVAASHPDATLTTRGAYAGKWNSEQAEEVRQLRIDRDKARAELAALRASLGEPVGFASDLDRPSPRFVTDLKFCTIAEHEAGDHIKYIPLYAIKDAMLSASPQAPDHTEDALGMVQAPQPTQP
jgi:hypothetical protein